MKLQVCVLCIDGLLAQRCRVEVDAVLFEIYNVFFLKNSKRLLNPNLIIHSSLYSTFVNSTSITLSGVTIWTHFPNRSARDGQQLTLAF